MTILVTGATGTIGRQVVEELMARGRRVRALTRDPARAKLPAGAEVVAGDLARPDTLASALRGVSAMHLITFDGATSAPLTTATEILERAMAAGVRRVTTFRGTDRGPVEDALEASPLEWTDLFVPVEFMANALAWSESIRAEGVARAFGPKASAMVHERDVGAVAATALIEDGHTGRTYVVTGPEALTPLDKVRTISDVVGREVRLHDLTESEARAKWQALGYPSGTIDFLVEWHRDTPSSAYTPLPTVREVTGRAPRTFAQWVAEHADAFQG